MNARTRQIGYSVGIAGVVIIGFLATSGQYIATPTNVLKVVGPEYATAVISPTDTGTQNDYAPTGIGTVRRIRWNGASNVTITGIKCSASADCAAADDGREIEICNVSTSNVTVSFSHDSASSAATNRIYSMLASSFILNSGSSGTNSCAVMRYDGTSTRWRLTSHATSQFLAVMNFAAGVNVSSTAHVRATGTSPAVTVCGGSPSIVGSDLAFRVTIGTTASNACTMTFAATYTNAPSCVVYPEGAAAAPRITTSATAIVFGTTVTDSGVYHVHCIGVI